MSRYCKKLRAGVLAIILCVLLYPAFAGQKVRVGIYQNPPKVMVDENGQPAGIFVDVIKYVAQAEDWDVEFVSGTWVEGLDRLTAGEIDLMTDVANTAERAENFSFHKLPVLSSWFQVYAREGSGIKTLLDLDNKKVVVLAKSVQEASLIGLMQSFQIKIDLIGVPDYDTVFQKVSDEEADAAVTNRFFGNMNARKYGLEDTSVIFSPSSLHFATAKGRNLHLLEKIDSALQVLRHDHQSIYYDSLKRWTSDQVTFNIPAEFKIIAILVLGFLSISVAGGFLLRHQVNVRTLQLQQSHAELERRVLERTSELADAMERAESADRIKSAFLASMSHELRTPLNSIIGFTGIMLQGLAGPLNQEQNKQLGMVKNSSKHLLSLINDILDISKIEAGQLELMPEVFALAPALEKVLLLLGPQAKNKGIELKIQIADNVGEVYTDQRRVEQVVLNLLTNAVKFTEKGSVKLTCSVEGDNCLIEVTDTGIGIAEAKLQLIFEPFHQVDSGLARKYEGTGLGLSICCKLLKMMGGSIDVKSRPGQGSIFYVSFPVKMEVGNGKDIADN